MAQTADVIIIGGGIHGSSLAFHLAKRGVKAVVLERKVIAAGATGRSSGLVRMHYDLETESRLAWESFQYFYNWEELVGGECGFTRTGFLQLVSPEHEEHLKTNVALHQKIGISTFLVGGDDVKRLAPSFSTEGINFAAYEPESGYADPYSTTAAFLDAARRMGAKLVQDCEVTAVDVNGGRVTGVKSTQGDYAAPVVINCAGPWAARIGDMVGIDLPVDTWQHDTMMVQRPKEIGPSHPTVIDDMLQMYFRPETGGLTLVGLEDNSVFGESPDSQTDHAKPGFVEQAIERIVQRVPMMEAGSLQSAHGGYDGISPDQRAILGQAGPEGFYLQCGFSGTGFKIAPAVGKCMAELILDGEASTVDIMPFRFQRFEEGEHLESTHGYGVHWR
jgi:sarcosine oxidase subunit beta